MRRLLREQLGKGRRYWVPFLLRQPAGPAGPGPAKEEQGYLRKATDGDPVTQDPRWGTRVKDICDAYLASVRQSGSTSAESFGTVLKVFVEAFSELTLADLTPGHVQRWLEGRTTWGTSTRGYAVQILQAALNWAAKPETRMIPFNPIRGMRAPRIRSRGKEVFD
jgi:hypothetical protein